MTAPDLVTVTQAAKHYGCATSTVRAACVRGDLPAKKVGRGWIIERAALKRWRPQEGPGRPRSR